MKFCHYCGELTSFDRCPECNREAEDYKTCSVPKKRKQQNIDYVLEKLSQLIEDKKNSKQ
jgi:recombinational DNA repair protein RecR